MNLRAAFGAAALAAMVAATPVVAQAQPVARIVAERQEQRIAQLRTQLRITPAQEPQWGGFVQVMRDNAEHMRQVISRSGDARSGSAVDDMRAYAAITDAHAEGVRRLVPAFDALYATMSPEQRKLADDLFKQYARRTAQRLGGP